VLIGVSGRAGRRTVRGYYAADDSRATTRCESSRRRSSAGASGDQFSDYDDAMKIARPPYGLRAGVWSANEHPTCGPCIQEPGVGEQLHAYPAHAAFAATSIRRW